MLIDLDSLVSLPMCSSDAHSCYQLSDAASGLSFLHSCSVIHGDLKGVCNRSRYRFSTALTPTQPNILVDDSGSALIADFGLAMVAQNPDSTLRISRQRGYTPQWTAPEILKDGMHSKEADIFSFAMVMIEVRHRRFTLQWTWPTAIPRRCRYSPARFRLVIVRPPRLCWPYRNGSARLGRRTQALQMSCGH